MRWPCWGDEGGTGRGDRAVGPFAVRPGLTGWSGNIPFRLADGLLITPATALSCLSYTDPWHAIPAINPYIVMCKGGDPVQSHPRPGAPEMAVFIQHHTRDCTVVPLGSHGPVVVTPMLAELRQVFRKD